LNENNEDGDSKSELTHNPDRFALSHVHQTSIMRPDFTDFVVSNDQKNSESLPDQKELQNGTKKTPDKKHDYFPQLSAQTDHVDVSQMVGLKPNFTMMHKRNYYSKNKLLTTATTTTPSPNARKTPKVPHHKFKPSSEQQNKNDRPGMQIQELIDADVQIEPSEINDKSDRFATDILNPYPSKPTQPSNNDLVWIPK